MHHLPVALTIVALIAAPASAQQVAPDSATPLAPPAPAPLPAPVRAHRDLQCAALYAASLGIERKKDAASPKVAGLASLVTFFMGRALGANPSIDIKRDLNVEIYRDLVKDADTITKRCQADALQFGLDMKAAGEAMQAAARDAEN